MPIRAAAKRCPDAVFLPTDPAAYDRCLGTGDGDVARVPGRGRGVGLGRGVRRAQGDDRTDNPEALAASMREAVLAETGLSCSIGIGNTRLQAKTATGFAKPAGIARLSGERWLEVMGDKPVEAIWGIGAKTSQRLAAAGIATVVELAAADPVDLALRFGPTIGPHLRRLGCGGDR
ncbi:MAG: DNA polymerase IV, partial [Actinomycetes bacterium]